MNLGSLFDISENSELDIWDEADQVCSNDSIIRLQEPLCTNDDLKKRYVG